MAPTVSAFPPGRFGGGGWHSPAGSCWPQIGSPPSQEIPRKGLPAEKVEMLQVWHQYLCPLGGVNVEIWYGIATQGCFRSASLDPGDGHTRRRQRHDRGMPGCQRWPGRPAPALLQRRAVVSKGRRWATSPVLGCDCDRDPVSNPTTQGTLSTARPACHTGLEQAKCLVFLPSGALNLS